jgi:hypothetical protein
MDRPSAAKEAASLGTIQQAHKICGLVHVFHHVKKPGHMTVPDKMNQGAGSEERIAG